MKKFINLKSKTKYTSQKTKKKFSSTTKTTNSETKKKLSPINQFYISKINNHTLSKILNKNNFILTKKKTLLWVPKISNNKFVIVLNF